ncbi:MAG: glycosyltransferase family 4 protein [Hyphomicrobiaceae bacterium]|nr:MAG: glycosyltransferase family 4 protein [Hyphomicrobiaceae bacterium]
MLSDLAFHLAGAGFRVEVITSRLHYNGQASPLPSDETVEGVWVRRVWTSRFGRGSILGRAIDYTTFYVAVAIALARRASRGAVVVVKTDPPALSAIAAPVARLKGAIVVNWLQDIFPEVAARLGFGTVLARAVYRPLKWARDKALKLAACNVVLGERMASFIAGLGVNSEKVETIHNWADAKVVRPIEPEDNPLRNEWGLEGKIVVGYSGNLGRAHDVATLLGAIKALQANSTPDALTSKVVWLFIGGGANLRKLVDDAKHLGIGPILVRDYQPKEKLAESLSAADVHIVSLRPELEGLIQPSKVYGVMAAGRPAIFVGDRDGETARLLALHDCGLSVAEGECEALAAAVLRLASHSDERGRLGRNARLAFETHYDKSIAVARWQEVLERVARRTPKA